MLFTSVWFVLSGLCAQAIVAQSYQEHSSLPEPDRIYWVQVGSFPDDVRADALLQEIEARGFSPVCIYRSGPNRTVRVGEFRTMMDAQLAFNDLGDDGYEGLRIRYNSLEEERAASREWAFQPYVTQTHPNTLFHLEDRPFQANDCLFDNASCAIDEGGHRADDRLIPGEIAEQITLEANELNDQAASDDDPSRGVAYFQLADLAARRGELDMARELALPVADGRYAAPPQTRWDAMWLMARVYHARTGFTTLFSGPSRFLRCKNARRPQILWTPFPRVSLASLAPPGAMTFRPYGAE